MVLENVADSAEPSPGTYNDTNPSSDLDPYAASSAAAAIDPDGNYLQINPNVRVDLNALPHRFSVLLTRPHPTPLVKAVAGLNANAAHMLHRPVTQEEADALAENMARTVRTASFGTPIGIALSTLVAYRGQDTMRFPLWSPFKEGSKLSPDVLGPLRGQAARAGWQLMRMGAYWMVGSMLGGIFYASYGITTGLVARAGDPRLREYNEVVKAAAAEAARGGGERRRGEQRAQQAPGQGGAETWEMARQRRGVQGQGQRGAADDASPTGGMFEHEVVRDDASVGAADTEVMNDGQMRQRESKAQRAPSQPQPQADKEPSAFDFGSPQSEPSASPQPSSGGSSWERLRQSSMSSSPSASSQSRPQSQGEQKGSSGGNSFSFSQQQEDRELAKSEAQRKFDARIDREREGKDFSEGQRGSGWRR